MQTTKQIILGSITFVLQTGAWWFLSRALTHQASTQTWVWLGVLSALAISFMTFFFLTNKIRWFSEGVILASFIIYIILLPKDPFVIIGGLLFTGLSFWYEIRLQHEGKGRVDFSVTRVVGASVSLMIYALLLLLGFNIYYNVATDLESNPDRLYERLGHQAAKSVPYFTEWLPEGTNLSTPFADYLNQRAASSPYFDEANRTEREILINEARNAFAQQFQISPQDNQSLADIMAEVAVSRVRQATSPYERYLPLIFTVIIVGLLFTFAFLIRWTVILISWLVFQLLYMTGFFKFEKVLVEVKKLVI